MLRSNSIEANLYVCVAGIGSPGTAPTWIRPTGQTDIAFKDGSGETEATVRREDGDTHKISDYGQEEVSIDVTLFRDITDAGYLALLATKAKKGVIGVAIMSKAITKVGSDGKWFDAAVLDASPELAIDKKQMTKFTLKPGISEQAPCYVLIGGCDTAEPTTPAIDTLVPTVVYRIAATGLYTFTAGTNTRVGVLRVDYTTGAASMVIQLDAQAVIPEEE